MKPATPNPIGPSEDHQFESALRATFLTRSNEQDYRVLRRGGNWILARRAPSMISGGELTLERLRLTPLEDGIFGLSLRRHDGRWSKLPVKGNLPTLQKFVHEHLSHWLG